MNPAAADDDRPLVDRLRRSRDPRAFADLYQRHTPRMYRLALALCQGDRFAAEDVVHDAWLAAVPRLGDFQWRARLATWLSGFVVNFARARMRAGPAGPHEPLDVADVPGDDRELTGAADRLDLERALAALAHGYREVLVLHDVEGFTHQEIAAMLGVTTGASKSQLSRARAAMRRLLSRSGDHHV